MSLPLALIAFPLLAAAGGVESALHCRALESIGIRICVNGTRGKSTVTRLIAAGLRGGGFTTVAKTTGTAASLILPDGSEEPVKRRGEPRITEQLGIVRRAASLSAQAIVVECMAINPESQKVFEAALIHSTLGVITNARVDHRDQMGTSVEETAIALASTVPRKGKLLLGPTEGRMVFEQACATAGTELIVVEPGDFEVAAAESFPWMVFPESLALALVACSLCGVDRKLALEAMRQARPDQGVRDPMAFSRLGRDYFAVDAFAANDLDSTLRVWESFGLPARKSCARTVMVVNHRSDRPWRIDEMAQVAAAIDPDLLIFTGELGRLAKASALPGIPVEFIPKLSAEAVVTISGKSLPEGSRILLFLAGNAKGRGLEISLALEQLSNSSAKDRKS
ncbi:MAG: poly-gamma-glutamate synthase PgsB [Spirochaetes bacterium]|nr:poly-gamma-glutamate synthase PgsB [Spirochaetota bacterium]